MNSHFICILLLLCLKAVSQENQITIGVSVYPNLSNLFDKNDESESSTQSIIAPFTRYENSRLSFSSAIIMEYFLSKKLSVEAGTGYTSLNYNRINERIVSTPNSPAFRRTDKSRHYNIELPLIIHYYTNRKKNKLSLDFFLGLSYLRMFKASRTYTIVYENDALPTQKGEFDLLEVGEITKNNIALTLGAGVIKAFSKNIAFFTNLNYRQILSRYFIVKSPFSNHKMHSVGVVIGIKKSLG